jgi:hypothetical protein
MMYAEVVEYDTQWAPGCAVRAPFYAGEAAANSGHAAADRSSSSLVTALGHLRFAVAASTAAMSRGSLI